MEAPPISILLPQSSFDLSLHCSADSLHLLILLNGDGLSWDSFTGGTWVSCIAMGVAVYLIAEVAWTWANTRKSTVPYTALPYLTPAISAAILSLSAGTAITPLVAAALAITLGANLVIMRRGR